MATNEKSKTTLWKFPNFAVFALALVSFCSCSGPLGNEGPTRTEVARLLNPSKDCIATVIEINGGATVDFAYSVNLENLSTHRLSEIAFLYGAQRSDSAAGINIRWADPNHLVVEYLWTRSQVVKQAETRVNGRCVSVELQGGVRDQAAPAGGMARSGLKEEMP